MAREAQGNEITRRIRIRGMVQGVGMRPFIALLADEFGISGTVKNVGSNVEIVACADANELARFIRAIRSRKPEMAELLDVSIDHADDPGVRGPFRIIPSSPGEVSMLPADFPVCADCLRELRDPADRRWRHPFISCAVCGPRYSVIGRAPYDRGNTSMADFPMCPECEREYNDPRDRRYHAQTISCHNCGPYPVYRGKSGEYDREAALGEAVKTLREGGIVAVKGVGGFHLACSPQDESSVRRLRALKGRELKPFAVMFRDMDEIRRHCEVSDEERALLLSPARPIVLLRTRGAPFAPSVSGDALLTGAFLPYTPLQVLLLDEHPALVMTSANLTGQPEICEDAEMLSMLSRGELAGVLYHARRIVTRLDDSVARLSAGQRQLVRRSRGYAPRPVAIRAAGEPGNVIAYGSDLKSAFCLLRGSEAYMSQYFGDMEELEVQRAYRQNLEHMRELFAFAPELSACDMHPGYHSSLLARACGLPLIEVQHHHAHIASVIAEHGLAGPVIGVAFDGTGYGEDGAIWGGEFLLCEGGEYERRAHLGYVALAGGDSVAVDARRAALCYCAAAGIGCTDFDGAALLRAALEQNINTVRYSGMGRLFDAASALLGVCDRNGYEGQCAVALENEAHKAVDQGIAPMPMDFDIAMRDGMMVIDARPVIRAVAGAGGSVAERRAAALGFHEALCRMVAGVCGRIRSDCGADAVALSGGTFQNGLLLSGATRLLRESGFHVYTNNEVPCNDGGLALGQAYVAAAKGNTEV